MEYCERLERDAATLRGELSSSIDELERRMTPGHLFDEAVDYARDTPVVAFFANLAREVRDHPLPLLLIAAGIAWAIVATSRSRNAMPEVATDRIERVKKAAATTRSERSWLQPEQPAPEQAWEVTALTRADE